MICIHWS